MKKNGRLQMWVVLVPEIKQLIADKNFSVLKKVVNEIHPTDLAEGFSSFTLEEKLIVFRLLNLNRAVALFEDLDAEEQSSLIENLENNPLENLLSDMAVDEKAKIIKKLPERLKKKLLNMMQKEEVNIVEKSLKYDESTAGAVMNTYFISLSYNMTVKQAIERVHSLSKFRRYSDLNVFYVVDNENKLLGGVSLRKLVAAPSDIKVSEIMSSVSFIKISPNTHLEEVAKIFSKYDLVVAPVVDDNGKILGIITIDDVIDIINAINTKQIYSVGKMSAEGGQEIKYSDIKWYELVKRRAGWLILLLILDFFTGTVLKHFEEAISAVVALTFFIPMLLDTGGNAGAQVSITLIRAFATGDVSFKNLYKVIKYELMSSGIMCLIIGSIAFLRAYFLGVGISISMVVGLSMCVLIILAIVTGIILPVISKKIGLDPAVLAGPITTSIVDIVGLIIYFKIAQMLLPQLRGLP